MLVDMLRQTQALRLPVGTSQKVTRQTYYIDFSNGSYGQRQKGKGETNKKFGVLYLSQWQFRVKAGQRHPTLHAGSWAILSEVSREGILRHQHATLYFRVEDRASYINVIVQPSEP